MLVANGALARIRGGRVTDNRLYGVAVFQPGSELRVAGLLVDGTRAAEGDPVGGGGFAAGGGATLHAVGSRVLDNRFIGVAFDRTHGGSLVGTVVARTLPGLKHGSYGTAVTAYDCLGTIELTSLRLLANHSAGASFTDSDAAMDQVVIIDTAMADFVVEDASRKPGDPPKKIQLGDGIVVHGGGTMSLRRSVVAKAPRAALLLDGTVSATVEGNLLAQSHWGMVGQGGAKISAKGNLLLDNHSNIAGDTNLFVPAPPKVLPP